MSKPLSTIITSFLPYLYLLPLTLLHPFLILIYINECLQWAWQWARDTKLKGQNPYPSLVVDRHPYLCAIALKRTLKGHET